MRRLTLEDAVKLAIKHNGECISNEYVSTKDKMDWKCSSGHKFVATYSDVKSKNSWCPVCKYINSFEILRGYNRDRQEYIRSRLQDIARDRGGLLVSDPNDYKRALDKLLWMCSKGHIFGSSYQQISNQDQWCPYCKKCKTQFKLQDILQEIFPVTMIIGNYRGFDWLKTDRGRQEIDIYIPELKLAVEYNGEQHYRPTCFGSMTKKQAMIGFDKQKRMDKRKRRKIREHAEDVEFFIVFDYTERKKLTKAYVTKRLIEEGVLDGNNK